MGMNFIITCMGRSGSKFLANVLNSDPNWTVEHEPYGDFQSTREVAARFYEESKRKNYGEVNSFLRFQANSLLVNKIGIILRNPLDIYQSMVNRGNDNISHLLDALYALDGLARSNDCIIISFSKMTQDENYLRFVASQFGLHNITINLVKVNESVKTLPMDPKKVKELRKKTEWFDYLYGGVY
jgi:hypothetical protein